MKLFEEAKKHVHKPSKKKRTIVVVDDSPAIIMRIKEFLKQLGYDDIQTASNGKGALEAVASLMKSGENPIVLLDMELPDLTGDVVATKLIESKPDISIIFITADEKNNTRVNMQYYFISSTFVLQHLQCS